MDRVLNNFGQFIGMDADELASMDAADREVLLKKLLACHIAPGEPDVAQYICANLDFDGVAAMHEYTQGAVWDIAKHDPLPPSMLHEIFEKAAVLAPKEQLKQNEGYQRFREKISLPAEATTLKLFHSLHLPNLRQIVLHTVGDDIVKANELHDKLLYYKREVEGPKRSVIKEDLNDLLITGITAFKPEFFSTTGADASAPVENDCAAAQSLACSFIPFVGSEVSNNNNHWTEEKESELRGALKPFYKLAGLPLNFPARVAAKQFVLLSRSAEVPDAVLEPLLHRDQVLGSLREKFAQNVDESHRDTMYQKAMEPIAHAITGASPPGEAPVVAENAMCLHFYNTALTKEERKQQQYTAPQFFSKFFIENEQPVGKFWIKKIAEARF